MIGAAHDCCAEPPFLSKQSLNISLRHHSHCICSSRWAASDPAVEHSSVCLQDIAASYVLGAAGGLVYLRMLHKHLDNLVGGNPLGGFVSSQRLLVPIIMVMAFNR